MALFKTREPRKFHHPYIYINERKEKLKAIEERAKRELGMLPPKEFNPEEIRGTFVKGTKHFRYHYLPDLCRVLRCRQRLARRRTR